MKRNSIFLLTVLLMTCLLLNCTQDMKMPEFNVPEVSSSSSSSSGVKVFATKALLTGTLVGEDTDTNGDLDYYFLLSRKHNLVSAKRIEAERNSFTGEMDSCHAWAESLNPGSTYYYSFCVANNGYELRGDVCSFKTKDKTITKVTTQPVSSVSTTSAVLAGSFVAETDCSVLFYLSKETSITSADKYEANIVNDSCFVFVDSLNPNTTYYAMLTVSDKYATMSGNWQSFTTPKTIESVETGQITSITTSSAKLTGTFSAVTECSAQFLIAEDSLLISAIKCNATIAKDSCFAIIDSLKPNTTYYAKLLVSDEYAEMLGNCQSFTTLNAIKNVTTGGVRELSITEFEVSGFFEAETQCEATFSLSEERSFKAPRKVAAKIENGLCSATFANLKSGKTYYYRLEVSDAYSMVTGDIFTFVTRENTITSLVIHPAANISFFSASVSGGFKAETECSASFVYSKNSGFYINAYTVSATIRGDSCFANLEGLDPMSVYYYKLVIRDQYGTEESEISTFTTLKSPIELKIDPVGIIGENKVTLTGSFVDNGVQYKNLYFDVSTDKSFSISNLRSYAATRQGSVCSSLISGLKSATKYYYRLRVIIIIDGVDRYIESQVMSFSTLDSETEDLGLSVVWAKCNLGAAKPEDYGDYYAWGETETKNSYLPSTYKYSGQDIGSNISGTQYDVARVKLGGTWRMPTFTEMNELATKCTWIWTSVNGVNGYKVVGPNGNSIFMPAGGYRYDTTVDYLGMRGSYGYYWTATEYDTSNAYNLHFSKTQIEGVGTNGHNTYDGHNIRPVKSK